MTADPTATRDRLILAAADLFRRKGYHATGIAEVLAASGAPKGSLYHHFPDGKADLAVAAADWTAEGILAVIDASFAPAPGFREGAATLCHKLAKLYDITQGAGTCPVAALLFDGPDEPRFHDRAQAIYDRLIATVTAHAARLGQGDPAGAAELVLAAVDGGWTMARARRSSDVLRRLAGRILT
jgi:TetR/AcrR family transcriptional repressor of lmrAB and yxaGH operons